MGADVRIGISGWRYAPWRGVFYPPRWPQARELQYAAQHLRSVEINGSFYRVTGRAWMRVDACRPVRHAVEVRHESFRTPAFVALLRRHRIALVVADTAGKWPFMEDLTADFVYARLHGDSELYVSGYTDEALAIWARKIRAWATGGAPAGSRLTVAPARERRSGRDVFVYFDNDVKVHAPFDAMVLAHRLDVGPPPPDRHDGPGRPESRRARWPDTRARRRNEG